MTSPQIPQHTIVLPDRVDRAWVENQGAALTLPRAVAVTIDMAATRSIDSTGIAVLLLLKRQSRASGGSFTVINATPDITRAITAATSRCIDHVSEVSREKQGLFVAVGTNMVALGAELVTAFSVLAEMLYWGSIGCFHRRDFRKGSLGMQMYQLGFNAVGIVTLLAFLIGVVLALQTAIQLKAFGADIFLAPMIGISMLRELGPLMTAIILAGRTGSATTAEIATMGVQEELDALRTMSINPIQFVVVPKFWAITFTMPLLSILSVGAGIFGGFLVAVLYLDTAPGLFMGELFKNIFIKDFMAGFLKSIVFSWLIIWIGAYYGLKVRGGAEEVGRNTTASVVTGIFVIILADAIFSFVI